MNRLRFAVVTRALVVGSTEGNPTTGPNRGKPSRLFGPLAAARSRVPGAVVGCLGTVWITGPPTTVTLVCGLIIDGFAKYDGSRTETIRGLDRKNASGGVRGTCTGLRYRLF